MTRCLRKPITQSTIILVLLLFGTAFDLRFEWSVCSPGDPPSVDWCYQQSFGSHYGMFAIISEDSDGTHSPPQFRFGSHAPKLNQPFVSTGWWDWWIRGVATWLLALVAILAVWLRWLIGRIKTK